MGLDRFPFVSTPQAMLVARLATAGFFMAHAVVRIVNGSIPQFGGFMERQGFPQGIVVVWIITAVELVSGSLLIAGRLVRPAAMALFTIVAGGIVIIHRHFGWFVGEHGIGGSEYSAALIVLLLLISANDRDGRSA